MRRLVALSLIFLMLTGGAVGAIPLLSSPRDTKTKDDVLVQPFEFAVNGAIPYTIRMPLRGGQTVRGHVGVNGGSTSFLVELGNSIVLSEPSASNYDYRFTAQENGTYDVTFTSQGYVIVKFDAYQVAG